MLVSFIVRICLSFFGTLQLDQGTFIAWSNNLVRFGFRNFYQGWSDYLPGYMYVLWILGHINQLGVLPSEVLYKLPSIFADLITGYLIYLAVAKLKNKKAALIAGCLYLFNPAVFANSALWGQIDSFTAMFSMSAIWFFPANYLVSALSLSIGTLVKPQAAFVLPVILYLMYRRKIHLKKALIYALVGLIVFVLAFIPFSHGNLFSFIISRLGLSASQYPYTSINAFNFWGLIGFWRLDTAAANFQLIGIVASLLIMTILFLLNLKAKNKKYYLAAASFIISFMFLTRIHERHLLPSFAPLLVASFFSPSLMIVYWGLSLTYLANLYYSFQWISFDFLTVYSNSLIHIFIFINLVLFLIFFLYSTNANQKINNFIIKLKEQILKSLKSGYKESFPEVKLTKKTLRILLTGILVFAFFSRVLFLGSPKNEYFDEVYHAFTSRLILHGDPKAWEWWNPHPEGYAYEWTHPPLAKLGMVVGMNIFGENAFGWRIPAALLGVGIVFLVYKIAKHLFEDELLAIISAAFFSLDGLALAMSRIGMNDTYMLFFVLLSIYLFLKKKNLFSALVYGLALASKWSAVWAVPIFFVIWLRRNGDKLKDFRKLEFSALWFLVIPPAVYIATYLPMFFTGHAFDIFVGMQKQMWWYHTNLKATHPYTSAWWSWPLLLRPIYLYTSSEVGGMVSRIYAMGNPIIFWSGLVFVITSLIYTLIEKNKNLGLVIFSYFVFFATWADSPRIMFLYHYLPALPFLAIASGYVLRKIPKLIVPVLALALVVYLYFYPHYTGIKIPLWLDHSYYWFASWR